jgi:hypothetical protein
MVFEQKDQFFDMVNQENVDTAFLCVGVIPPLAGRPPLLKRDTLTNCATPRKM